MIRVWSHLKQLDDILKQLGFRFTGIFPFLLAIMVLTSCSGVPSLSDDGDSILRDKSLDYAQAKVINRILVPDGLNDAQIQQDLLTIPKAQLMEQSTGIKDAPRPDFVFAQTGSDSARLTGDENQQRISVAGTITKVQGHVAQFWSNQGIALDAVSSVNVIETEWFSLSEKPSSNDFISRWIRSLTKSDENIANGRVKVELSEASPNRVELSLYFVQLTQLEIAQNQAVDWQQTGRALAQESEITFELLRYLSHTAHVAKRTNETNPQPSPLLGKDQYGRPLVQLNMSYKKALPKVLAAMSDFDVGSHDAVAKKVYFTHTSHSRLANDAPSASGGLMGWFKDLHTGKPSTGLKISLSGDDKDSNAIEQRPVYSSDPQRALKETSLADKKGYKIWLGGKVIYVFEDEDQGDVSDSGEYTYVGQFQLNFEETLNSVYLQIFDNQGQPADSTYAEEILWRLQQQLVQ
jgi:outer membrane protein assembly factor BamC